MFAPLLPLKMRLKKCQGMTRLLWIALHSISMSSSQRLTFCSAFYERNQVTADLKMEVPMGGKYTPQGACNFHTATNSALSLVQKNPRVLHCALRENFFSAKKTVSARAQNLVNVGFSSKTLSRHFHTTCSKGTHSARDLPNESRFSQRRSGLKV
jgi:hypothetical protein